MCGSLFPSPISEEEKNDLMPPPLAHAWNPLPIYLSMHALNLAVYHSWCRPTNCLLRHCFGCLCDGSGSSTLATSHISNQGLNSYLWQILRSWGSWMLRTRESLKTDVSDKTKLTGFIIIHIAMTYCAFLFWSFILPWVGLPILLQFSWQLASSYD